MHPMFNASADEMKDVIKKVEDELECLNKMQASVNRFIDKAVPYNLLEGTKDIETKYLKLMIKQSRIMGNYKSVLQKRLALLERAIEA